MHSWPDWPTLFENSELRGLDIAVTSFTFLLVRKNDSSVVLLAFLAIQGLFHEGEAERSHLGFNGRDFL